ncbi:hypothetical protein Tco_0976399 [Tanacetum coccineum]|uniref:CCHC-type domain-containing protein n=1 Tax=Tanacetum coccineum TaxID=301880 RepID=A0ABQ5EHJ7_9ASTR
MSDMTACLNDLSYIPLNNEQNEPTQGDIGWNNNDPPQAKRNEFEELYASANEELYPGCDYVTQLDFMAKFTYFKVKGDANKDVHFCPVCNTSRWKDSNTLGKKVPKKVLRYFFIIPRLQRLSKSSHTAKEMTWHATGKCTEPGKMQHPVDGRAWKDFDTKYPDFAAEPRSVRLSYFILTLLIPGPKSPGKDIDVYLRPLIDDLKDLWAKPGVETIDVDTCLKFNMRAMVFMSIKDFSSRSSFSLGESGQGYKACPTCNEDTPSVRVLVIRINHQELKKVIWYILHNSPEIDTYRAKFKSEFPNKDMKEEFPDWFGKQMSADVARGHGGDGGGDDRPPSHQIPIGCGGCLGNQGKGTRKPNLGDRRAGRQDTRQTLPCPSVLSCNPAEDDSLAHLKGKNTGLLFCRSRVVVIVVVVVVVVTTTALPVGSMATQFDMRPHMESDRWPLIDAAIQQHLQKIYNGKKIGFWNDPKNRARAAQNKQNRAKSKVVCRQGSRSIAALRDMHMESSTTREYPSLIHTFFLTHTVNDVFLNPEDKALYDEMLRLQGLGSNTETGVPYTEDEIMAIVHGGKQRGHIPDVGKVLPRQGTVIPPPPPCTHGSDVVKLKKRKNVLTRQPEIGGGSGSGGREDDEQGDDEDDGEDGEDEDDKLVILVNIDLYLADNASFVTSSTDVVGMALPVQNINHSAFRSMFEKEKLSGNNFNDWFARLKLVLRVEKKMHVIEQPLPPAPEAGAEPNIVAQWTALYDAHTEIACLMLGSMTPELHRQFELHYPYDMIQELRSMFEKQAGVEKFDLIQSFHACKQEEGKSVADYVLKMKGYVEQLKRKNKVNGKGKDKKVYIPKPNNPKPTAKERPAKDDACHHCKEVGHWKRNCLVYLAELQKKRKQVGSASSSDMVRSMMNLTTLPLSFWDYALEYATRILNMVSTNKVDKIPYELWYRKFLNLSYLKVWGCEALEKRDTPDKLE